MPNVLARGGYPKMIPYTPAAGDVTAGAVVLLGNTTGITCGVVHHDIANTKQGAVAAGGGFYDGTAIGNYANYALVYWDAANAKFTTTSTNNAQFGYIVSGGSAGANTVVRVIHDPAVHS